MRIGCLGLGKLGLPYALALAYYGEHDVYGWDISADIRAGIFDESPEAHGGEPGVVSLLQKLHHPRFAFAKGAFELQPPSVISVHCEVVFIVVPTPSLPSG